MRFPCPHCQVMIDVVELALGSDVQCPQCGSSISSEMAATIITLPPSGADLQPAEPSDESMSGQIENLPHRSRPQLKEFFGRFQLFERLGGGNFGEVFRAYDPSLDRIVALKRPHRRAPPRNDAERQRLTDEARRFTTEAQAAAQLHHRFIAGVYEVGEVEGRPYFTAEYVRGIDLAKLIAGEKEARRLLPVRQVAQLCGQVAEALHAAHEVKIVHRDLKPANILVGEDGLPRVMDFGMAKRESAAEFVVTQAGTVLGSPAYMSPEQWQDSSSVGRGTDIWALGVMLFEMLTGEFPFRASRDNVRLKDQVLHDVPPPPSQLNSQVPADLDTLCLKCLEKDPQKRYATAKELADELGRFLNGEPILARPISNVEKFWRWCLRKPVVAGLSAAVVVSVLAGVIATTVFGLRAVAAEQKRVLARLDGVLDAEVSGVSTLLKTIDFNEPAIRQRVHKLSETPDFSPAKRLRLELAWLQFDPSRADDVCRLLQTVELRDIAHVSGLIPNDAKEAVDLLWATVEDNTADSQIRFRSACLLAQLAPPDDFGPTLHRWKQSADAVGDQLVEQIEKTPDQLEPIRKLLFPLRRLLLPRLATLAQQALSSERQRTQAIYLLTDFAADDPTDLANAIMDASPTAFKALLDQLRRHEPAGKEALQELLRNLQTADVEEQVFHELLEIHFKDENSGDATNRGRVPQHIDQVRLGQREQLKKLVAQLTKDRIAEREARVCIALFLLGNRDECLNRLQGAVDPRTRTFLIHNFQPLGIPAKTLLTLLDEAKDASVRKSLMESLGEYPSSEFSDSDHADLVTKLLVDFESSPSAVVHSAAEWLLKRLGASKELKQTQDQLSALHTTKPADGADWYSTAEGHTMVGFTFSPSTEDVTNSWVFPVEEQRMWRMNSKPDGTPLPAILTPPWRVQKPKPFFYISSKEVTIEQFRAFQRHNIEIARPDIRDADANPQRPITEVTWYEAAGYCNWLSEREGIPKSDWSYEPNMFGKYDVGMGIAPGIARGRGYRLLTEMEWELACRAGTNTPFYFGNSEEQLPHYAWNLAHKLDHTQDTGLLKANDLGLFDMLGNVWEWCHNQDKWEDWEEWDLLEKGGLQYGFEVVSPSPADKRLRLLPPKEHAAVIRGGGLDSGYVSLLLGRRAAFPRRTRAFIGFRVARSGWFADQREVIPQPDQPKFVPRTTEKRTPRSAPTGEPIKPQDSVQVAARFQRIAFASNTIPVDRVLPPFAKLNVPPSDSRGNQLRDAVLDGAMPPTPRIAIAAADAELPSQSSNPDTKPPAVTYPFGGGASDPLVHELPPGQVDIESYVTEAQTGRLSLGVGQKEPHSPLIGVINFQENNFDYSRFPRSFDDIRNGTAWRGAGQQFQLIAKGQTIPRSRIVEYSIAWKDPYWLDSNLGLAIHQYGVVQIPRSDAPTSATFAQTFPLGSYSPVLSETVGPEIDDFVLKLFGIHFEASGQVTPGDGKQIEFIWHPESLSGFIYDAPRLLAFADFLQNTSIPQMADAALRPIQMAIDLVPGETLPTTSRPEFEMVCLGAALLSCDLSADKGNVFDSFAVLQKAASAAAWLRTNLGSQPKTTIKSMIPRPKRDDSSNLTPKTSGDLLQVCVRIRVKNSLGVNFGSGTIIDSGAGQSTILTCGHIFKNLDEESAIEVDVFNGTKHETFGGRVLRHDREADVGVLSIPTTRELPVAIIAGLSGAVSVDQDLVSVGCSDGNAPSKQQHRVTALNRYAGPANVECTGLPALGRSGSGLFDSDGRLIGVCIAADQREQRGLYAGLKPIHEMLNQLELSNLYLRTEENGVVQPKGVQQIGEPIRRMPTMWESVLLSPFDRTLVGMRVQSPVVRQSALRFIIDDSISAAFDSSGDEPVAPLAGCQPGYVPSSTPEDDPSDKKVNADTMPDRDAPPPPLTSSVPNSTLPSPNQPGCLFDAAPPWFDDTQMLVWRRIGVPLLEDLRGCVLFVLIAGESLAMDSDHAIDDAAVAFSTARLFGQRAIRKVSLRYLMQQWIQIQNDRRSMAPPSFRMHQPNCVPQPQPNFVPRTTQSSSRAPATMGGGVATSESPI